MDAGTIVVILLILGVVGWIYHSGHKAGKREGSRKGYGVGFDRGRRSKGQNGCLVALLLMGLTFGAAVAVWANAK